MHVWFSNILDDNGDIEIPRADGLVIRGCDKAAIFVHKGDGVDRTQML